MKVIIVMDAALANEATNKAADMIVYEDGTVLKHRGGDLRPVLLECSIKTLIEASKK